VFLGELLKVTISNYAVGAYSGTELVEEFDRETPHLAEKYANATVTSVHVLNEETVAIHVAIPIPLEDQWKINQRRPTKPE